MAPTTTLYCAQPCRTARRFSLDSAATRFAGRALSLHLANSCYFVMAVALVALGGWKRWLNRLEVALAAGLLAIPYLTRSHEMCLAGMGRFVAAVPPLYLVLGQLLARLPPAGAALVAGLSAFLMGAYAALFAAWYRFF